MAAPLKPSDKIERLSRAVHPGLLDTAIDPHLMIILILANLMSDTLWQVRDRIADRAAVDGLPVTDEMLSFIDHHFTHDFPMGTAERVGILNLQDERDRLGAGAVDTIKAQLWRHVTWRRDKGQLTPALDIFPLLEQDQLPIYTYSTIDGLHAMSRLLKHKKHRPMGVTVCADEATLTTSLASVLNGVALEDVFIVGSPGHYTTLLQQSGRRYWCNGKPESFSQARWADLTTGADAADPGTEFERRMPYADRFLSMFGVLKLGDGVSTIPRAELTRFEADCAAFFGTQLPPFEALHRQEVSFAASVATRDQLAQLDAADGAASARQVIDQLAQGDDLSVFGQAAYCYRDLHVRYPGAYLSNALRGPKLRKLAASVRSIDQALAVVSGIAGRQSIFQGRDRIAMPDEVLLFGTADDVDRGLLLLSLLLAAAPDQIGVEAALKITQHSTYLQIRDRVIDVDTLSDVRVEGEVGLTLDPSALTAA